MRTVKSSKSGLNDVSEPHVAALRCRRLRGLKMTGLCEGFKTVSVSSPRPLDFFFIGSLGIVRQTLPPGRIWGESENRKGCLKSKNEGP